MTGWGPNWGCGKTEDYGSFKYEESEDTLYGKENCETEDFYEFSSW